MASFASTEAAWTNKQGIKIQINCTLYIFLQQQKMDFRTFLLLFTASIRSHSLDQPHVPGVLFFLLFTASVQPRKPGSLDQP